MIICQCKRPAQRLITKKLGPNQGRPFFKCQANLCKFFQWEDPNWTGNAVSAPIPPPSMSGDFHPQIPASSSSSIFPSNVIPVAPSIPAPSPAAAVASRFASSSSSSSSASSSFVPAPAGSSSSSEAPPDSEAPICPTHKCPCSLRQVSSDTPNKGKWYWHCDRSHKCYFLWASAGIVPAQAKPAASPAKAKSNFEGPQCEATITAIGKKHFCLDINHSDAVFNALGNIPEGKREDMNPKQWIFPFQQHDLVVQTLQQLATPRVVINPIPAPFLQAFQAYAFSPEISEEDVIWERIPQHLRDSLLPFQREGVVFGVNKNGKFLCASEMGTGKSIQAIAVASHYRADWPLLIICPSSLRLNWSAEIQKWTQGAIRPSDIKVILSSKDKLDGEVVIISYDLLPKIPDLASRNFQTIIADECHYLKSDTAVRTKTAVPLIQRAKHAILLSGTPSPSRPIELFSQLSALAPDIFKSKLAFGTRYCNAHQGRFGMDWSGAANLAELHSLLESTVMVRRLKNDVLSQLPSKRRQQVFLQIDGKDLKAVKLGLLSNERLISSLEHKLSGGGGGVGFGGGSGGDGSSSSSSADSSKSTILFLFAQTARSKIQAVCEYMSDLIESETKFIIFAHHKELMDAMEETAKKKKVQYIRIDGSTPPTHRHERAKQFQESEQCTVAILSITAAGTGLTLTAATNVIFAELFWTPGTLVQCEDRVHRIGQHSPVNVRYLLAKGTLDDRIWPLIERKLEVIGEALNGQEEKMNLTQSMTQPSRAGKAAAAAQPNIDAYFSASQAASSAETMPVDPDVQALLNESLFEDDGSSSSSEVMVDSAPPAPPAPPVRAPHRPPMSSIARKRVSVMASSSVSYASSSSSSSSSSPSSSSSAFALQPAEPLQQNAYYNAKYADYEEESEMNVEGQAQQRPEQSDATEGDVEADAAMYPAISLTHPDFNKLSGKEKLSLFMSPRQKREREQQQKAIAVARSESSADSDASKKPKLSEQN